MQHTLFAFLQKNGQPEKSQRFRAQVKRKKLYGLETND